MQFIWTIQLEGRSKLKISRVRQKPFFLLSLNRKMLWETRMLNRESFWSLTYSNLWVLGNMLRNKPLMRNNLALRLLKLNNNNPSSVLKRVQPTRENYTSKPWWLDNSGRNRNQWTILCTSYLIHRKKLLRGRMNSWLDCLKRTLAKISMQRQQKTFFMRWM
jgi:hypothetical protein